MTSADTLLATLAGALVGAVVGALAAWLFALDLRRRERQRAYAGRLDAAVVRIVEAINEVVATVDPGLTKRRRTRNFAHETTRLLFEVDRADIVADSNDSRVLRALTTRILEWSQIRDGGHQVFDDSLVFIRSARDTVRSLALWRRGEIDAKETWRRLHRDTSPVVPSPPNPRRKPERPPD